jgi:protein-S-isoprenylcysteine O-methyltransferase Ste14
MYVRLSLNEEREAEARFGESWRAYAGRTPRFVPRLGGVKSVEAR